LTLALAGTLSPAALPQQTDGTGDKPVTLELLRVERRQAERDKNLSKEQRQQVLEILDRAVRNLGRKRELQLASRQHDRKRAALLRQMKTLQAELDRPTAKPKLPVQKDAPVRLIEQVLAQERAELKARRQALADLERLSETDTKRRTEIATLIGEINQSIEDLGDRLRLNAQTGDPPAVQRANQLELLAKRDALQQEIQTLRAEQEFLDARAQITPLLRDRAQRRVAQSERLVEMLQERALARKRAEGLQDLETVHKKCDRLVKVSPILQDLAAETKSFADMLWGADGVVVAVENADQQLSATRKQISQIRKINQITRRKFEAVKLQGVSAQWWPVMPPDLPNPADLRREIRRRERLTPVVAHRQIGLEEKRTQVNDIERQVSDYVDRIRQIDETLDAATLEKELRDVLTRRRDLLNELIRENARYSDRLLELDSASKKLLDDMQKLDRFLWERVFWTRSVPGSVIPQPEAVSGAFVWLFANPEWKTVFRDAVRQPDLPGLVLVFVLFPLLLFLRPWLIRELTKAGKRASRPERARFRSTLTALLVTLGLAAPLPVILFGLSRLVKAGETTELGRGVSSSLAVLALIAALIEFLRDATRQRGLCVVHFGWNREATRIVQRRLRRLLAVFLPLAFVTMTLAAEGIRFHSRPELQAWNNSLGRICFILAVLAVVVFTNRVFRPSGRVMTAVFADRSESWVSYFRYLWYPLLILVTIAPALFAAAGYYVTGFMLAYQLLRTLAWTLLIIFFGGMLVRWRFLQQRRLVRTAGDRAKKYAVSDTDQQPEILAAEAQVRQLSRFVLSVAWMIGFVVIWSQAVPTFQIFHRIEVWPHPGLIGTAPASAASAPAGSVETKEAAGKQSPETTPKVLSTGQMTAAVTGERKAAEAGPQSASRRPLTLAALLTSLFLLIFTIITAKNIPGLLEFTVLRRIPMGPGVRTTISTLVRYLITIIGISVAAWMIGLGWSKVQWLAAALTFGLGFGLQEIFANFVSGIIILLDRPIRVGDIVTIEDAGGWVSKISIRATTITKWDRSELIVPNREFITGKLVNWTLSNPLTRVEIKVSVNYDSDVEEVRRILLQVAETHPAILKDPRPYVVLMEFGDDAIEFELRIYINYEYGRLTIRDEVQRKIAKVFREKGITIAYPQLDVHIKPEVPEEPTGLHRLDSPPAGATPRGLNDADDD